LSIFDSPLEIITPTILHASATKRKDIGLCKNRDGNISHREH